MFHHSLHRGTFIYYVIRAGGGGVDENITDYVDRGRGLQKVDMFPLKSGLYHQFLESKAYVLIYLYISLILYYKIFKWG